MWNKRKEKAKKHLESKLKSKYLNIWSQIYEKRQIDENILIKNRVALYFIFVLVGTKNKKVMLTKLVSCDNQKMLESLSKVKFCLKLILRIKNC